MQVKRYLRHTTHRNLKSKDGRKLWKNLTVKVFVGGKTFHLPFRAAPGEGLSEENIQDQLDRVIEYIDKQFPKLEFKQVQIAPNAFNFLVVGERDKAGVDYPK